MPRKEPGLAARTRGRKLRAPLLASTGRGVKTRRERHRRRADHPALPPPRAARQRANRRAERRLRARARRRQGC